MDPIAGFSVCIGDDKSNVEFVLCVNQIVKFKTTGGLDSRSFDFKWTARPNGVGMPSLFFFFFTTFFLLGNEAIYYYY